MVSVDPRSGAIRAYYGGESGVGYDFAQSGLQTGSSFKVFGLAANLDQGVPLSQTYDSGPLTVNGIKIGNVEGESCGQCTIAEALKRSLNTSFYRMMLEMDNGPQAIADMAHKLGVAKELPGIGETLTEPEASAPTTASCWASTSRACSTWPRRTPRSRRPAVITSRTSCRRS